MMFHTLMLPFSDDPVPYAYQVSEETFYMFEHLSELDSIPQETKASTLRKIHNFESKLQARKLQAQIDAYLEELRLELRMEERKSSAMNQARNLFHGLDTP